MAKLKYSYAAQRGLAEIQRYYPETVSTAVGNSIIDEIISRAQILAKHPHIGPVFITKNAREYRKLVLGHYLCIYRIIIDEVTITRVFDSRRNPKAIRL